MATFEEREIVDYTIKKLETILEPENFMIKDLDKMHSKIEKLDKKLKKIVEKINNLENTIRRIERENFFNETSSESD